MAISPLPSQHHAKAHSPAFVSCQDRIEQLNRIAWSLLSIGKAFDTHKLEVEAV